jgi:positive regulator of sigma E activity
MTARAIVRAAHPDGTVDLEIDTSERCRGCAGVCLWGRMAERRLVRIAARETLGPGTSVEVALPVRYVLAGSLLLHGVPLAALLLGAAAGAFLTGSDGGAVAGAVLAAALGLAAASGFRRRLEGGLLGAVRIVRDR